MIRRRLLAFLSGAALLLGLALAGPATPAAGATCAATGRTTTPYLYVPSGSHTSITVHIVGVGDRTIARGGSYRGCPDKYKVALFDDLYVDYSNGYTVTACADGWHTFSPYWGAKNGGSSSINFTGVDRIAACH